MGGLLPISSKSPPTHLAKRCDRALGVLTATGVVFRSELAVLLGTHTLYLLYKRNNVDLKRDLIPSIIRGFVFGLVLTVVIDSYFWLSFPLWPELSAFIFNILQGRSSQWGTSPFLFYLTSALPRLLFNPLTYLICIPFAIFLPHLRSQVLDVLIPNLTFVILYSFQPHKEWRFVVYIIPPLTAVAAVGASWIWRRRAKSAAYRLLALSLAASSLASFFASFAMLAVSSLNYPGAEALNRLHTLAGTNHDLKHVHVHMDTLTCMTGVTRFLQLPIVPPAPSPRASHSNSWIQWSYDKTEEPEQLLDPAFWAQFDYALAERPERVIGNWEVLDTIGGFAGLEILGPGVQNMRAAKTGNGKTTWETSKEGGLRDAVAHVLKRGEKWARKYITKGWWVGVKMKPKISILRRQKEPYAV